MQHIRLVFESLCRALIRFFDNRFIRDDDVEWYRMELDKSRSETQSLRDWFIKTLEPKVLVSTVEDEVDYQPIQPKKFKSFEQKRKELERASFNKAKELAEEARIAMTATKTTEELEEEVGISNG